MKEHAGDGIGKQDFYIIGFLASSICWNGKGSRKNATSYVDYCSISVEIGK
jgi:hypothetical protein